MGVKTATSRSNLFQAAKAWETANRLVRSPVSAMVFPSLFQRSFPLFCPPLFFSAHVEFFVEIFVEFFVEIFVEFFVEIFVEFFVEIFVEIFVEFFVEIFVDFFVEIFVDFCVEFFVDISKPVSFAHA